ncbi:MAG: aromatic amino acid transporter [Alysiella sp.]|uniref:aromatic amino acid transporter n=1 Tax=Alysiella sp. TaxID=1872483 RepID=UPI0026DC045C|nr:aromatic amino acid transporter [Alysiella sp.]MDO4433521.1 aromatic amino acid transporter [Alysiella sp.]
MENQKQPSVLGGACIIAGVCVGAGMLALPSAGSGAWTIWSSLVLILTMIVMTLSGWLLLEVYKNYDLRASFSTVTREILGNGVNIINNLAVYFVGGILLYAYITTLGGIFSAMFGVSSQFASLVSCVLFGGFVWHSTRAVDRISVLLIVLMVVTFVFSIFGLTANINLAMLFDSQNTNASYTPYVMMLIPVALTSFGYHHSVTSMRAYYGNEKTAAKVIVYGMLMALGIYLLWIWSIFGNLPRNNFAPVIAKDGDVHVLLQTLGGVLASESVQKAIDSFALAAVLSSFIGVGLGLFDFLADFLKLKDDRLGRSKTWLCTFLPPLVLSLIAPFGFVQAIGYAGAVATIWTCIVPALLVYIVRRKNPQQQGFKVGGGVFVIGLVLCFGVLTAVFHFMNMAGMLPVFKG